MASVKENAQAFTDTIRDRPRYIMNQTWGFYPSWIVPELRRDTMTGYPKWLVGPEKRLQYGHILHAADDG